VGLPDLPATILFGLGVPSVSDVGTGTWAPGPLLSGVPQPTPGGATEGHALHELLQEKLGPEFLQTVKRIYLPISLRMLSESGSNPNFCKTTIDCSTRRSRLSSSGAAPVTRWLKSDWLTS